MASEPREISSFEIMTKQLATVFMGLLAVLLALIIVGGIADKYYSAKAGQRKIELDKQDAFARGMTYEEYLRAMDQEGSAATAAQPAAATQTAQSQAPAAAPAAGGAGDSRQASAPSDNANASSAEQAPPEPPIAKGQMILPRPNLDVSDAEAAQMGEKAAVIHTTLGSIVVGLFPERAPKEVKNFIYLAESGFYNGQSFYRILPETFVETGSPNSRRGGTAGYWFQKETSQVHTSPGTVVMVPAPDSDLVSSEIAILLTEGGALAEETSVFGRVMDRFDVVEKIGQARVDRDAYAEDRVFITRIEIVDKASVMPSKNIWAGIDPAPPAPNWIKESK